MHQSAPHHCRALLPRASSPLRPCSAITERLRLPLPLPLTPSGSPSSPSLQPRACARASHGRRGRTPLPPLLLLLLPSSATTEYAYGSATDSPTAQPFSTAVRRWLVATAGAATARPPAHVARRPWAVAGHGKTFYRCALPQRLSLAADVLHRRRHGLEPDVPCCRPEEEEDGPRA